MTKSSLRVIKLITGDEIIGVVQDGANEASEDENYTLDNLLFVTNPMKILSDYDSKLKVHSLYLADWIPAISDSILPIDKQKVVTLGTPNKDLEAHYIDILLAQKLMEDLYTKNDTQNSSDDSDIQDGSSRLRDKLKKHKFDDDDIQ